MLREILQEGKTSSRMKKPAGTYPEQPGSTAISIPDDFTPRIQSLLHSLTVQVCTFSLMTTRSRMSSASRIWRILCVNHTVNQFIPVKVNALPYVPDASGKESGHFDELKKTLKQLQTRIYPLLPYIHDLHRHKRSPSAMTPSTALSGKPSCCCKQFSPATKSIHVFLTQTQTRTLLIRIKALFLYQKRMKTDR